MKSPSRKKIGKKFEKQIKIKKQEIIIMFVKIIK